MITNHETGEWLRLCCEIEHEPEYTALDEKTLTLEVLPGLLRPQALDLPQSIRERLALEFASGCEAIHV